MQTYLESTCLTFSPDAASSSENDAATRTTPRIRLAKVIGKPPWIGVLHARQKPVGSAYCGRARGEILSEISAPEHPKVRAILRSPRGRNLTEPQVSRSGLPQPIPRPPERTRRRARRD